MNRFLNLHRLTAFFIILSVGLVYLLLLVSSARKVISGFFMQLIFLVEFAQNDPSRLPSIIATPNFWANILGGLLWFLLSAWLIRGLFLSWLDYRHTKRHLSSLDLIGRYKGYYLFRSTDRLAFTSGFFNPQIYLSSALKNLCSQEELKAILLHEQKHALNRDPLKDFIVKSVYRLTPVFPFKEFLFGHYSALVEVNCDDYACGHLHTQRPIVSALYKILTSYQPPALAVSPFSATSERIRVLVGQKQLAFRRFFAVNLSVIALFILSGYAVAKTDLLFECRHLLSCFSLLMSSSSHLDSSLTTDQGCTETSSVSVMSSPSVIDTEKTCHDHLTKLVH